MTMANRALANLPLDGRATLLSSTIAAVGLILLGADLPLTRGFNSGLVVLAWAPVWIDSLRIYRGARLILAIGAAAVFSGIVLAVMVSSSDHSIDGSAAVTSALRVVAAFAGIGFVLWTARLLPVWKVATFYGCGAVIGAVVMIPGLDNPWKFALAWPVAIVVLGVASRMRSRLPGAVVLLLIAISGALSDYRSLFGFCLAAAVLLVFQRRTTLSSKRRVPRLRVALVLTAFAVVAYVVGTAAVTSGELGSRIQQRSVTQIHQSGSLLFGGRPEWAGTLELIRDHPWGYGLGAVPNAADISEATTGLLRFDLPYVRGFDDFLYGGQFKTHAVAGDLWVFFGPVGVLLAIVIIMIVLDMLLVQLYRGTATPMFLFASVFALWDMGFAPIWSALSQVTFAVYLALLAKRYEDDRLVASPRLTGAQDVRV
jgi:hypothetical protein